MTNPWNLNALDDAARKDRLAVLDDWVSWIVNRYGLQRVIPRCWRRHPALVEELNALELAWGAAFEGDDADPEAPLRWHEDLAKAKERLTEWDRAGCATGEHREPGGSRVRVGAVTTRVDVDDHAHLGSHCSDAHSGGARPGQTSGGDDPC